MSRRPAEADQRDSKRSKSDAPAGFDIADIRAKLAAKKASVEAQLAARTPVPPAAKATPPAPKPDDHAAALPPSSSVGRSAGPAALPPPPKMDQSVQEKLAAAKARIEAMNARLANPYISGSGTNPKAPPPPKPVAGSVSSIALHPLLMGDTAGSLAEKAANEKKKERDRYKTMAPKFSTVRANQSVVQAAQPVRVAPVPTVVNPYAAPVNPNAQGGGEDRVSARPSRKMQMAAPGRFVRQGDQLRNEQKMDALRQRIAEASKKAGLDSEFDTLERSLKRQPPPAVEWWDEALLPDGASYDNIESALQYITTHQDSLITHLIQHPIPIAGPTDKKGDERGLMLTKKEQKKMRRQRRQAELEDKRDRQKMGLLPPDPPKVRLANLMKVLTSDAVQDPTKVEAKVRKEVAGRAIRHEKDNQDRKLSAEERKEKEYQQLVNRERRGIYAAVFKIKHLTNGRHKFKVRETAKKDLLSGVCIFHPNFALVFVEGTDKGLKHYTKLMTSRIDWTEEARPLGDDTGANGSDPEGEDGVGVGKESTAIVTGAMPESLEDNKCETIWEGEVQERTFKQFRARHAETDTKAKEWLTPRWEAMWDVAKRWQWKGEDW